MPKATANGASAREDVDGRNKSGHDAEGAFAATAPQRHGCACRSDPGARIAATPCSPRLLLSSPQPEGPFMSWSVKIGSIAGTAIRIHVTFLLLLAFFFLVGWQAGSINDGVNSVVFVVLVF